MPRHSYSDMQRLFKDVHVLELEPNYTSDGPATLWIYTRPTHDQPKGNPYRLHVKLLRQFYAEGKAWPIRRWFFAQQTGYEFDPGKQTGIKRGWISDRHKMRYHQNMLLFTSRYSDSIQEKYPEYFVPGKNKKGTELGYRPHLDPRYVILSHLSHVSYERGRDGENMKATEEQFKDHTATPAKPNIHMPQVKGLDPRWKMLEAYAAGYGDGDVLAMHEKGEFL